MWKGLTTLEQEIRGTIWMWHIELSAAGGKPHVLKTILQERLFLIKIRRNHTGWGWRSWPVWNIFSFKNQRFPFKISKSQYQDGGWWCHSHYTSGFGLKYRHFPCNNAQNLTSLFMKLGRCCLNYIVKKWKSPINRYRFWSFLSLPKEPKACCLVCCFLFFFFESKWQPESENK